MSAAEETPMANIEAEYEVIACLLSHSDEMDSVKLVPEDFYDQVCREIYLMMTKMRDAGQHIDAITLADALPVNSLTNKAGGLAYLGQIVTESLGSVAALKRYTNIIQRCASERRLAAASNEILTIAAKKGDSFHEKISKADELISELRKDLKEQSRTASLNESLSSYIDQLDSRGDAGMPGITTGLTELDEMMGGIQAENLYVIGARPSMGKTSFVTGVAMAVAACTKSAYGEGDHGVLFLSQEMPLIGIIDRMMASAGSINLDRLIRGKLTEDDYTRLSAGLSKTYQSPLWINDQSSLSLSDVRALIRERRADNIKVVVIDYLQLMRGEGQTRNEQINNLTSGLKQIAKDEKVGIVLLSQLSRKVEERTDKRPMNSDLRESGGIEQDADVIMFIYRDEVYNPDTQDRGVAEIIVSKNRNGPIGSIRTHFRGEYTRFDNFSSGYSS